MPPKAEQWSTDSHMTIGNQIWENEQKLAHGTRNTRDQPFDRNGKSSPISSDLPASNYSCFCARSKSDCFVKIFIHKNIIEMCLSLDCLIGLYLWFWLLCSYHSRHFQALMRLNIAIKSHSTSSNATWYHLNCIGWIFWKPRSQKLIKVFASLIRIPEFSHQLFTLASFQCIIWGAGMMT